MARTRNQGSKWVRPAKRLAIYLRDGCRCAFCGRDASMGAVLTLDHLIARHLGGSNHESNLITACRSCNSSKQDATMRAWYKTLREAGRDTTAISRFIRTRTQRDLKPFIRTAKNMIASMEDEFANYGELALANAK